MEQRREHTGLASHPSAVVGAALLLVIIGVIWWAWKR